MEEGESNEDIHSQPNQANQVISTRDQRTTETNELPDWPTSPFDESVNARLELLEQELKKKDAKIDQLQEHILKLETELPLLLGKKKRRLSNDELEQQVSDSKDETIQRLQKEIDKLKEKLGESVDANNSNQNNEGTNQNAPRRTDTDIVKLIEEKLNNGLTAIKVNVNQLIEEKINTIIEPTSIETKLNELRSYANVVGKSQNSNSVPNDFRAMMMANRNEELAEETEKKRRSTNLIIHGKHESTEANDKDSVDNLIKDLQISSVVIKQVERIGQQSDNKKRPIKVTLKSEEEKDKILNKIFITLYSPPLRQL